LLFVSVLFISYLLLNAPSKLENVSFIIVKKTGPWKEKIVQNALLFLRPGLDISPEIVDEVEKKLSSLPWVEKCRVSVKGGNLSVEIWEEPVAYGLSFEGKTYLIGKNGFVLSDELDRNFNGEIFSYRGKTSPFFSENGFLRVKNSVKIEINLVKSKLKELKLDRGNFHIILQDVGVALSLKRPPSLIYLGYEGSSWERFLSLLRRGFLKPGIYDLRYSDMLILRGRNRNATE